jgi:glycosyltransferase involved in cell wall biosynthesis
VLRQPGSLTEPRPVDSARLRLPRQAPACGAPEREQPAARGCAVTAHPVVLPKGKGGPAPALNPGTPMVTCIMPTRDRLPFVAQAVSLFRAQTYPARELVAVDDSVDSDLAAWLPEDPNIRYIRARPGESIGSKRNRACAAARGEFIAHWDDDDWYSPDRLAQQIGPLVDGCADVTGLVTPVLADLPAWEFWRVTPSLHRRLFVGDVHGGTLVYRRTVWERNARYPDSSLAEDAAFLLGACRRGARLQRVRGEGLFIYVRLGRNAWNFPCGEHIDPAGWVRIPEPALPPADREFYLQRSEAERDAAPDRAGRQRNRLVARRPRQKRGTTETAAEPLVTCIMPTRNRRHVLGRAIAWFQRQDYRERELLILDDGDESVADLVPGDPRIRYVYADRRLPLGAKRNEACRLARGEVIAHWDDDDWYAPNRLTYQVGQLLSQGADVCGPSRVVFFEPVRGQAWLYEYPSAARVPWVAGSGLCYRTDAWRRNPFASVDVGEDTQFVAGCSAAPLVLDDLQFLVARVHPGNTSPKQTGSLYWRPISAMHVRSVLGGDYATFGAERPADRHSTPVRAAAPGTAC